MTYFKHIISSVLMVAGLGLATYAQSSALFPYEGAVHTYQWSGLQQGLDYEFYFTADASGNVVLDDSSTGEFDFISGYSGTITEDGSTASVPVKWKTGASLQAYYLWIKATIPGGCSNYRYVKIQPQLNAFDLVSENIPVDHTISCPSVAATDGFNAIASTYDAGSTTLKFVIRRVNGTDNKLTPQPDDSFDWSFEPVLAIDPSNNLGISIVSVVGVNSGNLVADSNKLYTVNGADDQVTVTVAIKNMPGTVQDVSLKIRNQIESHTNLLDSNDANDVVKHRIDIMPVINGLQGV